MYSCTTAQAIPRFYLTAVEKDQEKAWDHCYITCTVVQLSTISDPWCSNDPFHRAVCNHLHVPSGVGRFGRSGHMNVVGIFTCRCRWTEGGPRLKDHSFYACILCPDWKMGGNFSYSCTCSNLPSSFVLIVVLSPCAIERFLPLSLSLMSLAWK